ncbi:Rv1733c family protein [Saccharopolyspora indica]|uniref:Rv1733c family protein n=2 Tax=Saccharopolyspora indica TaxID=1229659 RepID=UPI0040255D6F
MTKCPDRTLPEPRVWKQATRENVMCAGWLSAEACWLGQTLGLKPNPLRRRRDRIEAVVLLALLVVALAVVPLGALAWGTASYEADARAAATTPVRHQVEAVVIAEPRTEVVGVNSDFQVTRHRAEARWPGADGVPQVQTIDVGPGSEVGSTIAVWIDDAGRLAEAPRSETQLRAAAVGGAVGVAMTGEAVCAALIACVRTAANARAGRAWKREWEIVGPQWTRQY